MNIIDDKLRDKYIRKILNLPGKSKNLNFKYQKYFS